MPEEPQLTEAVEVFYSYSHNKDDEELKDELLKQLAGIERQGVIVSWHDRKITAGQEWAGKIDDHINTAGVILLLVSPDFMVSGYCNDVELKRAMERHEAGESRVIPIILRPTFWKGALFGKLQMLPTDAQAVTLWANQDEALLSVAEGIHKAVEEVAGQTGKREVRQMSLANIPRPPVVGFVARRDEQGRDIVKLLSEELAPEKSKLIALWGPGGAGKTTLASEVVRATEEVFKGRVVWASSLRRTVFNLATLLDEIATQLNHAHLRTLAPESKVAQVSALVGTHPTLVVLDNFETIAEEEQSCCLDFLAHSAACPTLITTRTRINREDIYNIPLAAMTIEEARDFLQRLTERTRKPSNFDKLDRDDLIAKCEANPLILQWVVSQIDLAKRSHDVLSDLAQGEGDAAERVFTRSYNLSQVGDDGRAALLALSLFTPNASHEALAEVAGFGDDLRRLNNAVENLSALWLVETTEGNERLFLRGLTRELAKSRLLNNERADEFRRRYVAYFLRHAQAHAKPTPEDLDALEAEKDNLLGAIDAAFGMQHWESVMWIRGAMENFLFLHGYWDEAIKSGEQAEAAACEAKNERGGMVFTMFVARIRIGREEYEEATRVYQEALMICIKLGSKMAAAACLSQLGSIAGKRGDLKEARRLFGESLELYKEFGEQSGIALVSWGFGNIALLQGNVAEAKKLFIEALGIFINLKDQASVSGVLNQLAQLELNQSNLAEARRLLSESLEINKRLGNQIGIARASSNLGLLAGDEGDKIEAARLYHEALPIFEKLGSPEAERIRRALARLESWSD